MSLGMSSNGEEQKTICISFYPKVKNIGHLKFFYYAIPFSITKIT